MLCINWFNPLFTDSPKSSSSPQSSTIPTVVIDTTTIINQEQLHRTTGSSINDCKIEELPDLHLDDRNENNR